MKITIARLISKGVVPASTWKAQRFLVDILAGVAEGGKSYISLLEVVGQ